MRHPGLDVRDWSSRLLGMVTPSDRRQKRLVRDWKLLGSVSYSKPVSWSVAAGSETHGFGYATDSNGQIKKDENKQLKGRQDIQTHCPVGPRFFCGWKKVHSKPMETHARHGWDRLHCSYGGD